MFPMGTFGKILLLFGLILAAVGLLLIWSDKIPWIGRLPGDILIKKKNFTFYFPLATSLLISVILTLLFSFFRK
jgi:cell division protein FtsW (lipid II flippase)